MYLSFFSDCAVGTNDQVKKTDASPHSAGMDRDLFHNSSCALLIATAVPPRPPLERDGAWNDMICWNFENGTKDLKPTCKQRQNSRKYLTLDVCTQLKLMNNSREVENESFTDSRNVMKENQHIHFHSCLCIVTPLLGPQHAPLPVEDQ